MNDLTQLANKSLKAPLPELECFRSQFTDYRITIEIPEYTSVCPKTGLPDFGMITIEYVPDKLCVELKSLKYYFLGYRNLGISYENAVNRMLNDLKQAMRPKWIYVRGDFSPRGGIGSVIEVKSGKLPKSVSEMVSEIL
jgi:7-cyano-7-deazaguanine reductase